MLITAWRKRSAREKGLVIVLAVLLALVVFLPLAFIKGPIFALVAVVVVVLFLFAAILVLQSIALATVGIHELGHYFAGKWVGFKFYSMRIGPFIWFKSSKGLLFSFKKVDLQAYGYVLMGPTDDRKLMSRFRWFILGGPIASLLLLALVAITLPWQYVFFGDHPRNEPLDQLLARCLIFIVVIFSLAIVLSTCIPFRIKGIYNDAAKLLLGVVNKRAAESQILGLRWHSEVASGQRSADWNIPTIRRLLELSTAPFEKMIYNQSLGNALVYSGSVEEGLQYLEIAYRSLTKPTGLMAEFEAALALDTSFARAYFGKDLEGAKDALTKANEIGSTLEYGFLRAKAAIALLEGNEQAVRANAERAKEWLDIHTEKERQNIQASYEEMDRLMGEARTSPQENEGFAEKTLEVEQRADGESHPSR